MHPSGGSPSLPCKLSGTPAFVTQGAMTRKAGLDPLPASCEARNQGFDATPACSTGTGHQLLRSAQFHYLQSGPKRDFCKAWCPWYRVGGSQSCSTTIFSSSSCSRQMHQLCFAGTTHLKAPDQVLSHEQVYPLMLRQARALYDMCAIHMSFSTSTSAGPWVKI